MVAHSLTRISCLHASPKVFSRIPNFIADYILREMNQAFGFKKNKIGITKVN